jgi:hypothetical protein
MLARERSAGPAGQRRRIGVVLGTLAVLLVVGAFTRSVASVPATASAGERSRAAPDTIPPRPGVHARVDLRCLTDREEHCLDVAMSPDEPHGAVCATCHDMVAQRRFGDVRATCSGSGCHERPELLTPFHRGLTPGVLSNCVGCHDPHDVEVPGGGHNCVACHVPGVRMAEPRSYERHPLPGRPSALDLTFRHTQHQQVKCEACHSAERAHGRTIVTGLRDCRSCHHTQPLAADCTRCHESWQVRSIDTGVPRTMNIQLGSLNRPRRLLPFVHAAHDQIMCTACHTGGLSLSAAATDCAACHAAHHQPDVRCMDCHEKPAVTAHTRDAHLGCGGAGCHDTAPASVRSVPRTRNFCLACHQDLVDHRPEGNCADCHALPRPRIGR